MTETPSLELYSVNEYSERCLVMMPDNPKFRLLLIPPLFEEANKLRHFLVRLMVSLAADHDIGTILPDLPGTLESPQSLEDQTIYSWQNAIGTVHRSFEPISHIATFRGGCQLGVNIENTPQWQFTPMNAYQQMRTLARAQLASEREAGNDPQSLGNMLKALEDEGGHLIGYEISPAMAQSLEVTRKFVDDAAYTVRLKGDNKAANSKIAGSPLWLRSEPGFDEQMMRSTSDNIANWVHS